jgi:hypothetical protein
MTSRQAGRSGGSRRVLSSKKRVTPYLILKNLPQDFASDKESENSSH